MKANFCLFLITLFSISFTLLFQITQGSKTKGTTEGIIETDEDEKVNFSKSETETKIIRSIRTTPAPYPKKTEKSLSEYVVLNKGKGEKTFTFDSSSSFIQIGPEEISSYQIRNRRSVTLEFRTRLPHALLVYHGIKDRPAHINKYELYIQLDQGQVKIKHLFGDYSTTLIVGKGLNRDEYHRVEVTIDPFEEVLYASVDSVNNSKVLDGLKEYYLYGAENEDLESIIFIGGLQTGTNQLEISYLANTFIGCIKDVTLSTSSLISVKELVPIAPLVSKIHNNVKENCLNKCWDSSIPCARDAKCINHYDHVVCDCFQSEFKGEKCKDTNISILTLNGYSYVTFTVYEWMDRVHSDSNRLSLQFKTYADDSILFYIAGEIPVHNHFGASIQHSKASIHIDFGNGDSISTLIGENLNNGKWHKLTIIHKNEKIQIKLSTEGHDRVIEQNFDIKGPNLYLFIDPDIHIGGGGPTLKNRKGLNSTNNFIGCLKDVYYNEKEILYELQRKSHEARHHGLIAPILGKSCNPLTTIPITIPFLESGFKIHNPNLQEIDLRFEFKTETVVFATLAYSKIKANLGEGFWELKIVKDELRFSIQLKSRNAKIMEPNPVIVKFNRDKNSWSNIHIKYSNGKLTLKSERNKEAVGNIENDVQFSPTIILGTSGFKPNTGFAGCIRKIHIDGKYQDARKIVGSEDQIGDIALDNCLYVDPCSRPNVCEHSGKCSVQDGSVVCECGETGYIGKHCHFAMFKRTCEELALLGYKESGVYKIDIDGNGPYPPSHVKCDFESDESGETKTIVEHNLSAETDVWTADGVSKVQEGYKLDLIYREFTPEMLMALIYQSVQCYQHIKFDCYKTKIALHRYSWFVSAHPRNNNIISIGDAPRGRCPCSESHSCAHKLTCNCDSMENKWLSDEGYYSEPERLGITQLNFIKPLDMPSDAAARITLGPLSCVEANTQRYVVTFKTFGSYLEAPGWKSGDLAFSFRTTRSSGILLYQPLLHHQHNSFSVFLKNDHELIFRFVLSGSDPQKIIVRSQRALSGGEWQQVWIDYDINQVRFQINGEHQMINLQDGEQFGPFEGTMYIAGSPEKYLRENQPEIKEGLIGCFRGLVMNGQVLDLYSYMKFHKADIVKDCSPSCDPNPCQNNAGCFEMWGSFTCNCKNIWSQTGILCEKDNNVDGLTFLSQSSYIKKASKAADPGHNPIRGILHEDIFLNLRTYDFSALVLFANDHLNNFVQVHTGGNKIIFTWNTDAVIRVLELTYKGLNQGKSIQVAVVRNSTHTTLHINSEKVTVPFGIKLLENYSEEPWENPELELFTPPRPFASVYPYHILWLGGYDNMQLQPKEKEKIPGMLGCLRGLKIGNEQIFLSELANGKDVLDGCKMQCDLKPCLNKGVCIEDFQANTYSCDCTYTSYYGKNCNEERGASFLGESYVRRRFKIKENSVDNININFGFSLNYAENKTILLTVRIPELDYSILFAIDNEGHLILNEQIQNITNSATIGYQNFVNAQRHSIYYERTKDQILFLVDHEEIFVIPVEDKKEEKKAILSSNNIIEKQEEFVGEIFIAGVNQGVPELSTFSKFKGCMSNIYLKIYDIEMRPVEEYMSFIKIQDDVVLEAHKTEGIKSGNCAALSPMAAVVIAPDSNDILNNDISGSADWSIDSPQKIPLQLKRAEEVKTSGISFNTLALIFGLFLIIIAVSTAIYMYRIDKRYKRRMDEEDDLYFTNRGQLYVHDEQSKEMYSDIHPIIYRNNKEEKIDLIPKSKPSLEINSTKRQNSLEKEKKVDLEGIDDENAGSSDTSSSERISSSSSSLLSTKEKEKNLSVDLDDKEKKEPLVVLEDEKSAESEDKDELYTPTTLAEFALPKLPEEDEFTTTTTEEEGEDTIVEELDSTKSKKLENELPELSINPSASSSSSVKFNPEFFANLPRGNQIQPDIFLNTNARALNQSPIARIGGKRYQLYKEQKRKTSKDSIISLD